MESLQSPAAQEIGGFFGRHLVDQIESELVCSCVASAISGSSGDHAGQRNEKYIASRNGGHIMAKRRNRYLYNFTADTYIHSGAGVYEQMAQSLSDGWAKYCRRPCLVDHPLGKC